MNMEHDNMEKHIKKIHKTKKISHIEIYFDDTSMERIDNEKPDCRRKELRSPRQIKWVISECLDILRGFNNTKREVTLKNYRSFTEDNFAGIRHSEYFTIMSILDTLGGRPYTSCFFRN